MQLKRLLILFGKKIVNFASVAKGITRKVLPPCLCPGISLLKRLLRLEMSQKWMTKSVLVTEVIPASNFL